MTALPSELFTAAQTRELDQLAGKLFQLSASELMRRAGQAAFDYLAARWPVATHLLVVCGAGNNGGDGYEVARQAYLAGYNVIVVELAQADKLSETSLLARSAMIDAGVKPQAEWPAASHHIDLVVDAIFGTGLSRAVTGHYADCIEAINQLNKPVLSLDIPSGLQADTGTVKSIAIHANTTISFIGLNIGLFTGDAADYVGEIKFDSLALPAELYSHCPANVVSIQLTDSLYQPFFAPRKRNSHKGHYGHALLIGGNQGMSGAIRLSGEATLRTGAGLVSVATHPQHANLINQGRPELMCRAIEDADDLNALLNQATCLAIGPGIGQDDWASSLFKTGFVSTLPMVVDADALNLLAQQPQYHQHWILTPHPGEAARLLGCDTATIQSDRINAIRQLQQQYGGVIILKGSGTLIYDGQSPIKIVSAGNPGMASGGMGDALTGIITGLLAQKLSLAQAAELGVLLHATAADLAAREGERGLLASDLFIPLRQLLNSPPQGKES